ncbi:protein YABBY 2-like [Zingiber officinale]|uniref:Axial regulator YABBY 2 n=1 Tax=Zingiber officinale TaxID=94328 RepID=A0A8J5GER0_ZINOF|nr:protein YABBY 2-like [Zingiber officinale]KAG6506102.1 hypothetical protein ZIOFF_031417 [Zingiber officinale]
MSAQALPEHICYLHCHFCSTLLVVSVPGNSLVNITNIVTVRCGHCSNLLSVNLGALLHTLPSHDHLQRGSMQQEQRMECGSTSLEPMLPISPPEKRQRVPSAYNKFIKEEIQRIKANNPDISHREAFSTAAKNWAHFPHIHFGTTFDGDKQEDDQVDEPVVAPAGDQLGHQSFF